MGLRSLLTVMVAVAGLATVAGGQQTPAEVRKPLGPESPAMAAVAKEYYARLAEFEALEKPSRERDHLAMRDKTLKVPTVATGIVLDLWGRPVPGAEVALMHEEHEEELAGGRTDAEGRFKVDIGTDSYRGLTIRVRADGFAEAALGGIYGGLVDYPVRMARKIDDKSLDKIAAEKDDVARLKLVVEALVGDFSRNSWLLYPRLGELRTDLVAIAQCKAFLERKEPGLLIGEAARMLLVEWADPADDTLLEKWARAAHATTPKPEISGETIEEVCRKYADYHFEGKKERTANGFSKPLMGRDGNHALVSFTVQYMHWAYGEELVLIRKDGRWVLRFFIESWIT